MSTPLEQWVESTARLTRPAQIQWCDGSEEEAARIEDQLVREGQTFPLNDKSYPNCFLHRSDPSDVARTEKEVRLRKAAIHSLGLMGGEHTGAALVSMYGSESDTALRGEIINALFIQGNAKALVDLARKETNLEMKKAIVSKLSVMGSKEGADYMMELLSK